jgi:hypothetical protein
LLPADEQLLSDEQLRNASTDQIEDLVARINIMMQRKANLGLKWWSPEESESDPGLS